ncbi:MAG: hypothetical protein ACD_5C00354G0006 [uncultured bacterium]|nr:MAG: hypothetical protein ACD_5C00354G0006 [uncultured bacterium]
MTDEQKKILERQLWSVANVLRGKMHADEYKNYILGFIFYKYLSEKLELYVNEKLLVSEDFTFDKIKENTKEGKIILSELKKACVGHLGFFLQPKELFSYLVKKGKGEIKNQNNFILEDLKMVLNNIESTSAGTASEDDFKGLFDDMDLASTKLGARENQKNEVVIEVITLLNGIDFKLEDTKSDLLGDAYEYLIGEFAAGAGKKGGEFYTPAQVSRLLAQIVSENKKRIKSVYDPTCGSGSLLLRIKDYSDVVDYYGQELNPTTYNLGRMNMILHGVHFDHFKILQGDTLREDMHPDLKAEVIVANPPFGSQWKGDTDPQLAHDDRFSQYGRLAPKSAADYAFVTHMLHHLADNGTMAVVLPHGALFRSGAEGHIRKYIIEKQNFLDAVIGLPSNLFYGTSISATILVFKKCRRADEEILFIDASKEFEKGKNQNHLTEENIQKIFETYKDRKEIKKYSHRANLDEIKENEFNLNIPRYISTFEEEVIVNIDLISRKLSELKSLEEKINLKIINFCDKLHISKPAGNNIFLLKEYRKGIIQKIFAQEIRFLDNDGNNFPDWEERKLEEIFDIYAGKTKSIHINGKGNNIIVDMGGISSEGKLIANKYTDYADDFLTTNDLVMPKDDIGGGMIIGKVARIPENNKFICGDHIFKLTIKKGSVVFLFYAINSFKISRSFRKKANGTAQLGLSKGSVENQKIPFPSILEQQEIAEFLTLIDNLIELKQ